MTTLEVSSETRSNLSAPLGVAKQTFTFTLEHALYILIGIAALILHVWQLDARALHHDETLHAAYSWYIFQGRPYMHDPLLHGPFLYYVGSWMYFLFGDNDFTARLGFALFGTVLTLLPILVRKELGRAAALMASLYLLISPAFLYMGRFARHDIYSIVFEMLIFIAIVRYATSSKARWLYVGVAAFAFMFTNQETSYLFLLIIGLPLIFIFLWRFFKPAILLLGVVAVSVAAFMFVLPGEPETNSSSKVVRDQTTDRIVAKEPGPIFGWGPLETSDNGYALRVRNRSDNDQGKPLGENFSLYMQDIWKFFRHPAVLSAMGVTLFALGAIVWVIWFRRNAEGKTPWQRNCEQEQSDAKVFQSLGQDKRLLVALAIFVLIYVFFFTAMLTNLLGVITGTTGSLLYWLAQHDVQRGGQPLHYYVTLLAVYEPLALFWTMVGLAIIAIGGVRALLKRRMAPATDSTEDAEPVQSPLASIWQGNSWMLPVFLAWWSLAALFIYTWAGEKMPWLTVHIALPMVLLGSWACQWVLFRLDNASWTTLPYRILTIVLIAASIFTAGLGFIEVTTYIQPTEKVMIGSVEVTAMMLLLLMVALYILLIIIAGINWGWKWAFSVMGVCIVLLGGMYTTRSSYQLSYVNGDTPREMFIYTQTSPDVRRVVHRLEEISYRRTRGLHMPIYYDNETVWLWYLRNFTNARNTGPSIPKPDDDVMAIVVLKENLDKNEQNRDHVQGFLQQRMPLRWWFPEEHTYRLRKGWQTEEDITQLSLLGQVLRSPLSDETLIPLWQFLIYRDPGASLGSTDFVLAVRPEIADQIGLGIGSRLSGQ